MITIEGSGGERETRTKKISLRFVFYFRAVSSRPCVSMVTTPSHLLAFSPREIDNGRPLSGITRPSVCFQLASKIKRLIH